MRGSGNETPTGPVGKAGTEQFGHRREEITGVLPGPVHSGAPAMRLLSRRESRWRCGGIGREESGGSLHGVGTTAFCPSCPHDGAHAARGAAAWGGRFSRLQGAETTTQRGLSLPLILTVSALLSSLSILVLARCPGVQDSASTWSSAALLRAPRVPPAPLLSPCPQGSPPAGSG